MRREVLGVVALVTAAGLGTGTGRCAAGDTASRARQILTTHCARCHSPGPSAHGGLNVFDRTALRQRTELLDLVAGGSMPPGDRRRLSPEEVQLLRAWLDAGAPDEPPIGDAYVIRHLLADWEALRDEKQKRSARYVSLNHLLHSERSAARLGPLRERLEKALAALADPRGKGPFLTPVDPRQSVFRIDLAALGWDRQPFSEMRLVKEKQEAGAASPVRLHDLLLLEYPYGYLNFRSADFGRLATFLRQTGPLRPVPHLRGDWLLAALADTPLRLEFADVLGIKPVPAVAGPDAFRAAVPPDDAGAELGVDAKSGDLGKALARVGLEAGTAPSRAEWERVFPRLVKEMKLGEPIVPLNGLTLAEHKPADPFTVRLATIDSKTKEPSRRFKFQDRMYVEMDADKDVAIDLLLSNSSGTLRPVLRGKLTADKTGRWPDKGSQQINVKKRDVWQVIAYALPQDAARTGLLPGKWLRAVKHEEMRDRFVHPLYELRDDGKGFKPGPDKLLKATVSFRINEPD